MIEDVVRNFGFLCLGTRMKRIGERLQADTQAMIDEMGFGIGVSQFPFLAAVDRLGRLTIGELAEALGISQPGVTRSVALLIEAGLLTSEQSSGDQRQKIVGLTPKGRQLVEHSKQNVWPRIERAVADLCGGLEGPLLEQLGAIEDGLDAVPLGKRLAPPANKRVLR